MHFVRIKFYWILETACFDVPKYETIPTNVTCGSSCTINKASNYIQIKPMAIQSWAYFVHVQNRKVYLEFNLPLILVHGGWEVEGGACPRLISLIFIYCIYMQTPQKRWSFDIKFYRKFGTFYIITVWLHICW